MPAQGPRRAPGGGPLVGDHGPGPSPTAARNLPADKSCLQGKFSVAFQPSLVVDQQRASPFHHSTAITQTQPFLLGRVRCDCHIIMLILELRRPSQD